MLQQNYDAEIVDYGDVRLENEKNLHPPVEFSVRNLNVLGPLLGKLHHQVANIVQKQSEDMLLTIGGDHSIGAATVTGAKRVHPDLRVVWVDAHPDCTNSQLRNPTKMHYENYHGMPLSHITGMAQIPKLPYWSWLTELPQLDPKNVVLIAIRDIDKDEYHTLKHFGVKCFTMDHIDKYGIGDVMTQTINYLDPKNQHPFHLSFDVDGIDPSVVGQTGTLFRYGLSARESVHIVRRLIHERKMVSMDIVEINEDFEKNESKRKPYRGEGDLSPVTKTVGMGIDLMSSLFTKYLEL